MPIINTVIQGGGAAPSGKYQLLQRVKDDSNNEIGTVCGFVTDSNNIEYAVVCLDAQYRFSGQLLSAAVEIPGQGILSTPAWGYYKNYTATQKTQNLLDFATANNYTTAATNCRALTFTIDGVQYAGQMPYIHTMLNIMAEKNTIQAQDTSASSHSSMDFPTGTGKTYVINLGGYSSSYCCEIDKDGQLKGSMQKNTNGIIFPVLELPNA